MSIMSSHVILMAEWLIYTIHLVIFIFYLLFPIGDKIARKCLNSWFCSRHWQSRESFIQFFGYNVDLADNQWKEFRSSLPLLFTTAAIASTASWAVIQLLNRFNFKQTQHFRIIFGVIFIIVQHGLHSTVIFGICIGGILISVYCRQRLIHPFVTWAYAIFILLLKESYRIQHLNGFHFLRILFDREFAGGLYSWRLPANFLVLRIISYNMDVYWAHRGTDSDRDIDNKDKEREVLMEEYDSLANYFSYILYAPLYIAGPIVTYKAFLKGKTSSESVPIYFMRWLLCLAVMEYLTHRFPFFAVISSGLLPRLTVAETAVLFYLILKIMWLKFLLIWRFFRLWAMADGVDAPENMQRCMSNNHSLEQFWRGWHSSFNKWLVRYMYMPMGGRGARYVSVWLIFLFVALWHDLEPKLLAWGALNAFFYVLEVLGRRYVATCRPSKLLDVVCVMSSALYIVVLVLVNLVGYSGAAGELDQLVRRLVTWEGGQTLLVCAYFLVVGILFMGFLKRMGLTADSYGLTTAQSGTRSVER